MEAAAGAFLPPAAIQCSFDGNESLILGDEESVIWREREALQQARVTLEHHIYEGEFHIKRVEIRIYGAGSHYQRVEAHM